MQPMQMPPLGFGTFRLQGDVAYQAVSSALNAGYTHIDTAQAYNNESDVGRALNDSDITREDIFVTTKVWNDNLSSEKLLPSVEASLEKLQLSYVDLLLVHWPSPPKGVPMAEYLQALLEVKDKGLTKHIGVSNFTVAQLQEVAKTIPLSDIYTNQVEIHPYLQNRILREYCDKQGLHLTAYMPFAYGKVLKDDAIIDLANHYQTTPAGVVLAWVRQKGFATIPSSTKEANIQANLESLSLTLSDADIQRIDQLERGDRQANPEFSPDWD